MKGSVNEDEKEVFSILCDNYGLKLTSVKAPGSHLNKLLALCKKIKLKIVVDFTVDKFAIEYDKNVQQSSAEEDLEKIVG